MTMRKIVPSADGPIMFEGRRQSRMLSNPYSHLGRTRTSAEAAVGGGRARPIVLLVYTVTPERFRVGVTQIKATDVARRPVWPGERLFTGVATVGLIRGATDALGSPAVESRPWSRRCRGPGATRWRGPSAPQPGCAHRHRNRAAPIGTATGLRPSAPQPGCAPPFRFTLHPAIRLSGYPAIRLSGHSAARPPPPSPVPRSPAPDPPTRARTATAPRTPRRPRPARRGCRVR